jgi:hypothetical protein
MTSPALLRRARPCKLQFTPATADAAIGAWRPILAQLRAQWWCLHRSLPPKPATPCTGAARRSQLRMRTSPWGQAACGLHVARPHPARGGQREGGLYAAAPILHNRRLHLAVRRMVFLSVVRPVMDYAATVWHGTDAELTKIEQVQTRVLRRLVATREDLADASSGVSWHAGTQPALASSASWSLPLSRSGCRLAGCLPRWPGATGKRTQSCEAVRAPRCTLMW